MLICSAEHVSVLTKSCYQTQVEDQPIWRAHEPCIESCLSGHLQEALWLQPRNWAQCPQGLKARQAGSLTDSVGAVTDGQWISSGLQACRQTHRQVTHKLS